jgi:hypothetical protein
MNDSEFEESLRRLAPVAPGAGLEERIAVALAEPVVASPTAGLLRGRGDRLRRILWPGLGWAMGGAAAASVALLAFSAPRATVQTVAKTEPPASLFEPEESAREVVSSEEAGTLYDEDNQPSTLMRYTSIERHSWTNPATGAYVEVEIPRQDVVLVPASYQ